MDINQLQSEINKMKDKIPALEYLVSAHNNIIILGNGGSNSIASHISQDYTKVLKKRAFTFSDPSRLTCYINDYGMDKAYVQFLKEFCDKEPDPTLVILISSSGNSPNIVNCKKFIRDIMLPAVYLSGFNKDNVLNTQDPYDDIVRTQLYYHVDSFDYGIVECCHQIFLHSIL